MGLFDGIGGGLAALNPVGAVANIGMGLMQGGFGYLGQKEANEANAREAQGNREWMQWMSNSAHTREVEDLRNAGLNPILSANKGASTPSGQNAVFGNTLSEAAKAAGNVVPTIMDMKRFENETRLMDAQTANQAAQAQSALTTAKNSEIQGTMLREGLPNWRKDQEIQKEQQKWDQKMLPVDNVLRRVGQVTGVIHSAASTAKAFKTPEVNPEFGHTKDGTIYNKGTGEIKEQPGARNNHHLDDWTNKPPWVKRGK